PWGLNEWTEQDDTVRGGSSTSTLFIPPGGVRAAFSGNLDTKTLGGTGFASQRTTGECIWDLSEYQGIELFVKPGSIKTYSFNIKDLLPDTYIVNGTVRENSTLEYEATFTPSGDPSSDGERIVLPFGKFEATYRGRPQNGTKLNLSNIRRFSLMVRSFFGSQEGEFRLVIISISAVK
ncbi:NADH:ubiquinone oxidoreductase complex I intermediate-associated protein 30, partial [Tuber magnatum]